MHCNEDLSNKNEYGNDTFLEEAGFRFLRWQQTCKMSKDYWQTSHYLESTMARSCVISIPIPTVPITLPSRSYSGDL